MINEKSASNDCLSLLPGISYQINHSCWNDLLTDLVLQNSLCGNAVMLAEGCWACRQHRAFVETTGPIAIEEQAILSLKHLYFETFNFVLCAPILCTISLFSRFFSCCTSVHVSTFVGETWVWNGRLVRVGDGGDPDRVTASPPPNDRDEGDHRPLVWVYHHVNFWSFSLLERTYKKKKKSWKSGAARAAPAAPRATALEMEGDAAVLAGTRECETRLETLRKVVWCKTDKETQMDWDGAKTDVWFRWKQHLVTSCMVVSQVMFNCRLQDIGGGKLLR